MQESYSLLRLNANKEFEFMTEKLSRIYLRDIEKNRALFPPQENARMRLEKLRQNRDPQFSCAISGLTDRARIYTGDH